MTDAAKFVASGLQLRVGGFFRNTRLEHGLTCSVCRGPSRDELCANCAEERSRFDGLLADHVYPLTYVRGYADHGIDQSAYTVRAYKQSPPAPKCLDDMRLMVLGATLLHGRCMASAAGAFWAAVTFVPSAAKPGPEHPVAELARRVHHNNETKNRLTLELGPGIADMSRRVRDDRFVVPTRFKDRIARRHVLVVEDTWVTGTKVQSAAVALKIAGARSVTALCVARWCDNRRIENRRLLDSCQEPYDAQVCPVTGGACPAGSTF